MAVGHTTHVYIVAGEESGDRLGAALMRALKARTGNAVRFSGLGGEQMAHEGGTARFPIGALAITGFAGVFRVLGKALSLIRATSDAVVAANPDVLVIIDSPEFTLRVAKRVRAKAPAIPIVEYVSPSVWAWRPWRAKAIRRYVDHILALLPFEPEAHKRLVGPTCTYVGHPLAEKAAALRPNVDEARRRAQDPPIVLLMPGSRRGELRFMLDVFAAAAAQLSATAGPIEFVALAVPSHEARLREAVARWPAPVKIISDVGEKEAAMRSARAALVKSGTGTLELALAGVPMVAVYKGAALEAMIMRQLVSVPSVILPNLILGENVVPELLQDNATPDKIVNALAPLLKDSPERQAQLDGFARLDDAMETKTARPSDRAAEIVIAEAAKRT